MLVWIRMTFGQHDVETYPQGLADFHYYALVDGISVLPSKAGKRLYVEFLIRNPHLSH
jgi:hypothetical protein